MDRGGSQTPRNFAPSKVRTTSHSSFAATKASSSSIPPARHHHSVAKTLTSIFQHLEIPDVTAEDTTTSESVEIANKLPFLRAVHSPSTTLNLIL